MARKEAEPVMDQMESGTRRAFLLRTGGALGGLALGARLWNAPAAEARRHPQEPSSGFPADSSLRVRAAARGLLYGAATHRACLESDEPFAKCFVEECSIMVPEGELKWGLLRPSLERFDFSAGDWILQFATDKGVKLRGHTLVWHERLPRWFAGSVDVNNAKQVLVGHISTVVGHYANRLHSWDVVNEVVYP